MKLILNNFDVYFTLYDRSSLPLSWCIIESEQYSLPAPDRNGFYLLRIRPKPDVETKKCAVVSDLIQEDNSLQHWKVIN